MGVAVAVAVGASVGRAVAVAVAVGVGVGVASVGGSIGFSHCAGIGTETALPGVTQPRTATEDPVRW